MHVAPQQKVKLRLSGSELGTIQGTVERIEPSSTIRDEEEVFIAEVVLENNDGKLRPGMKGSAQVFCKKRALGWSLFDQPSKKIMTAIGF